MSTIAGLIHSATKGEVCQFCSDPLPKPWVSVPSTCAKCFKKFRAEATRVALKKSRINSVQCPQCERNVKEVGLQDHINDVHGHLFNISVRALMEILESA